MSKLQQWLLENTEPKMRAAELARTLGVAPSLITHWKTGERKPGRGQLKKLSKLTGLKIEDLIL